MSSTDSSNNSDGIIRIQANGAYDFDPSKLNFREPKMMTSGAKLVMLTYGDSKTNNQFMLETPTMHAPMGKMEWETPGAPTKHSIMLSMNDIDTRKDMQQFQQLLETVDRLVRTAGFEKSMSWMRKQFKTASTVDDMYQPLERKSRNKETGEEDGRWPSSVKLTLPYGGDGKPKFTTYNQSGQEIDIATVETRHSNITAIVCLQNVWIAGNMFGVSFKAVQLLIEPKRTMAACAFRNIAKTPPAIAGASSSAAAAVHAADLLESDDDDVEIGAGDE